FRRKFARIEDLPRADADLRETRHEFRFGRVGRAELQDEVQDVKELRRGLLFGRRKRLNEINGGRGLGGRLAEECRERLRLVAGLDFLNIVDVVRLESLCAIDRENKFRFRAKDLLHAFGRLAFPIRSRDHAAAVLVAAGVSTRGMFSISFRGALNWGFWRSTK